MAPDTDVPLTTFEYCCIAPGVHLRRVDDEMAVYLSERFETHLVDESGCEVLEAVHKMHASGQQFSLPALYALLTGDSDLDAAMHSESEATLMPLLSELVRIGVLSTRRC